MRRRVAGLAATGVLVTGVVVGAILSPGYPAVDPRLDGSSVWVADGEAGAVGLANTANATIERVLRVGSVDEAHAADGATVIVDRAASTIRAIRDDPAQPTAEPGPAVPFATGSEVQVRGDRIAITSEATGDVWRTSVAALLEGTPLGDPVVALGRGGVAVLAERSLVAASPGLGRVLRIDDAGAIVATERAPMSRSAPRLQLTALGDDWVLHDAGSRILSTRSWQTGVDADEIALQQPGPDAPAVVYATDDALVRQPIGIDASEVLVSGAPGGAARPLVDGACTFAAWSGSGEGTAWRACDGATPAVLPLAEISADARLTIEQRGTATAAVDGSTGDAWSIDRGGARISGWDIVEQQSTTQTPAEGETPEEQVESTPAPPVAEDDELGARPGAVTLLPVLLNDVDPNGDPIVISEAQAADGTTDVSVSPDGRTIRLVAPESGTVRVPYRISDGTHVAEAVATVTVAAGNEPPRLERQPALALEAGGTVVLDALDGWLDPDGDPLAVVSATAESPDRVTVRPDGRLELTDGRAGAQREVEVTVTDGTATAVGTLAITVHAGTVPIVADPITAVTRVGQRLVLEPLLASHGGSGGLSLHNVVAPSLPVEPIFADGTIEVRPTTTGVMAFDYVVTDGTATQHGSALVQVLDAVDASTAPVTRPMRALLPVIGSVELPVRDLAHDPAGGVVALTDASAESSAVRADVVDGARLRITLRDDLPGSEIVRYSVTNGIATAEGVVEVSASGTSAVQPPIARPDVVTVRPGGLVDIPVLANDEQPDGLPLSLAPELAAAPEQGLLFVDGDRLRYVASEEPGIHHATYAAVGPDGQSTTATVELRVVPPAQTTNAAPDAAAVEARVVAGRAIDIPIPVSDADRNGDPVQLLGPSSAPSLGLVTQSGPATLRYEAGEYSFGTDELSYRIVDDLGAVGEGTVRVVVVPPSPALPPVLTADAASMRPGTSLVVPVLADDRDPAGLPLRVVAATSESGSVTATVRDDAVELVAGDAVGDHGVVVTVENAAGAQASTWLRVSIDPDALPPVPDVADIRIPMGEIAGASTVTVDPLDHATVRDGLTDVLRASLPMAAPGASLRDDGTIDIEIGDRTRYVPFAVERDDSPGSVATAVIAVPGRLDALPQLRPGVAPLEMRAGETLEISIDDVVDTADGDGAILTDASTVRAVPSDGSNPVIDERTLRYVPPAGYFGPASIAFAVTDGDRPSDPDGRTGTIVLPIQVLPADDQPLTVLGSYLQLEPGSERVLDLARITRAPDPARLAQATWSIAEGVPPGFQATIEGSTLRVRALDRTEVGTQAELTIGARDAAGTAQPGRVVLSVISSTKPLVEPAPDAVTVRRGGQASVEPLANDAGSNPFPGTPLRLGGLRDAGADERGITAALRGDVLTVAASPDAAIGATVVHVLILDATGDPRRGVWSPVTVTVQDVPDAPSPPVQVHDGYVDGVVTMAIEPPAANGSPVTGYRIVGPGVDVACGAEPRCRITGLRPGVQVVLRAIATNALGDSAPSGPSAPVHADRLPTPVPGIAAAPAERPGTVRVNWGAAAQPAGGTPIEGYLVRVAGGGSERILRAGSGERSVLVDGLTPGVAYTVEVAATNAAGVPDTGWRWPAAPVAVTAVGVPGTTPVLITGRDPGAVTVRWSAVDAGGAARVAYSARLVPAADAASTTCVSSGSGTPGGTDATTATLPLQQGSRVVVAVTADNGWHCSVSLSEPVHGTPSAVDASAVQLRAEVRDDALDLRIVSLPPQPTGVWLEARVDQGAEGAWRRAEAGSWLTPTTTAFAYGRTTTVLVRACAPSGAGSGSVCSEAASVAAPLPLSLRADVQSCRPLVPLGATPPANATAQASASVQASYLVRGAWTERVDAEQPVPAGATQVRAWGVVAYGESEHEDPTPTEAPCGL